MGVCRSGFSYTAWAFATFTLQGLLLPRGHLPRWARGASGYSMGIRWAGLRWHAFRMGFRQIEPGCLGLQHGPLP